MSEPYITVPLADVYFHTERVNSDLWLVTPEEERLRALNQASNIIDTLRYAGTKDGEREFPRDGGTIPRDIEIACCEIAFALLDGVDIEMDAAEDTERTATLGPAKLSRDTSWLTEARANHVPSVVAWKHLRPYLVDPMSIQLSRVN